MMTITTIFFDFDGVLTTDKSEAVTTAASLSKALRIPQHELMMTYLRYVEQCYLGGELQKLTEELFNTVEEKVTMKMMLDAFRETKKYKPMFMLAATLKEEGYQLGIITDNIRERMELLEDEWKLHRLFKVIVCSFDEKIRKDNKKIFLRAVTTAKCKPEEAVFIDNTPSNLVQSRSIGMHTYHFDDQRKDMQALCTFLEKLGIDTFK